MHGSTSVPRWRVRATVDVLKQSLEDPPPSGAAKQGCVDHAAGSFRIDWRGGTDYWSMRLR